MCVKLANFTFAVITTLNSCKGIEGRGKEKMEGISLYPFKVVPVLLRKKNIFSSGLIFQNYSPRISTLL